MTVVRLLLFPIFLIFCISPESKATPTTPCSEVNGWREKICGFAKGAMVHPAWGFEHGMRDYLLAMELTKEENVAVDEEVLFAAGLLHDLGGFPPYEKDGVDHALRSTQVVEPILKEAGFPMGKLEGVKKAILTHSYYEPSRPETPEAIALHDADTLDFLGVVSAARLLSIVGKEKVTPTIKGAVAVLDKFQSTLTTKLYGGAYTQEMGKKRALELKNFLQSLKQESYQYLLP